MNTYLYNTNTSTIVIPWSGGVDSTCILFKVCNYMLSNEDTTHYVQIKLACVTSNSPQHQMEEKARQKILKYINKKYPTLKDKISLQYFTKDLVNYSNMTNTNTLHQPYWWLTTVLSHYGNDTILFGYHKGDDFWTMLDKFNKLLYSSIEYLDRNNVHISYPLCGYYKDDIFNELPKKVQKMVWYCENPINNKPCEECGSCTTHNRFINTKGSK